MNPLLFAELIALLPALSAVLGGVLVELFQLPDRALSLVLHAAAGSLLSVVGVELLPRSLGASQPWVIVLAFVVGGAFLLGTDYALDFLRDLAGEEGKRGSWGLYTGVLVDFLLDGMLLGAAAGVNLQVAFVLAASTVPENAVTGFVTVAGFHRRHAARPIRLLVSGSFAIGVLFGVLFGYLVVNGQSNLVRLSLLAFSAGLLALLSVEELIPRAHRQVAVPESKIGPLLFLVSFGAFAALSLYTG